MKTKRQWQPSATFLYLVLAHLVQICILKILPVNNKVKARNAHFPVCDCDNLIDFKWNYLNVEVDGSSDDRQDVVGVAFGAIGVHVASLFLFFLVLHEDPPPYVRY